jgi:hypothetical protein
MRYFLDNDEDHHYYVIPADKKDEWEKYVDDPENNSLPYGCIAVNGHVNRVSFTDPQVQ